MEIKLRSLSSSVKDLEDKNTDLLSQVTRLQEELERAYLLHRMGSKIKSVQVELEDGRIVRAIMEGMYYR